MPVHTVRQGDSVVRLAHEYGVRPADIWNHGENTGLRGTREHQNILNPGDSIFVPEIVTKTVSKETDDEYVFRRLASTVRLRIRLVEENGEPRRGLAYHLEVGSHTEEGSTDSEGMIDHEIYIGAVDGVLQVGDPPQETYELEIGHLDPLTVNRGIQARLHNLGFYSVPAPIDGRMGPETEEAIRAFQERHDLPATGEMDDATRAELGDFHGC